MLFETQPRWESWQPMMLTGCMTLIACAASSAFILPTSPLFTATQTSTELKASQPQEQPPTSEISTVTNYDWLCVYGFLICRAWHLLTTKCGAGVYKQLQLPSTRWPTVAVYTVRNDRELQRIIRNYGGTGLKLAENAVTPEGYIKLVTHLQLLDEKQVYAIQSVACFHWSVWQTSTTTCI
jgi:hypothetical protein